MLVCKFACKLTWVGVSLYVSLHVNLHPNLHTCNAFSHIFQEKNLKNMKDMVHVLAFVMETSCEKNIL